MILLLRLPEVHGSSHVPKSVWLMFSWFSSASPSSYRGVVPKNWISNAPFYIPSIHYSLFIPTTHTIHWAETACRKQYLLRWPKKILSFCETLMDITLLTRAPILNLILSQMTPFSHPTVVLPHLFISSKWFCNYIVYSFLIALMRATCLAHPYWRDHSNYILWRIGIMELVIKQLSPSHHFVLTTEKLVERVGSNFRLSCTEMTAA